MDERERIKEISGLINGILDSVKCRYVNKDMNNMHKRINKELATSLHRIAEMIERDEI